MPDPAGPACVTYPPVIRTERLPRLDPSVVGRSTVAIYGEETYIEARSGECPDCDGVGVISCGHCGADGCAKCDFSGRWLCESCKPAEVLA